MNKFDSENKISTQKNYLLDFSDEVESTDEHKKLRSHFCGRIVNDALEKGARYCVIDEEQYTLEGKTVLVEIKKKSFLYESCFFSRQRLNFLGRIS